MNRALCDHGFPVSEVHSPGGPRRWAFYRRSACRDVPSDDELIRGLQHRQLAWNSPLSEVHAERLLRRLDLSSARTLLDLGCGWGELMLRAAALHPHLQVRGVDSDRRDLDRARQTAVDRGLSGRAEFLEEDVRQYLGAADRVICVGASHAWGGTSDTLEQIGQHVMRPGKLLFGDGYWTRRPSARLQKMFGELSESLNSLVQLAEAKGWTVSDVSSADPQEWDDFENTWNQDLVELSRQEANTTLAAQAARILAERRTQYLEGYRGVLGFAYLLLSRG